MAAAKAGVSHTVIRCDELPDLLFGFALPTNTREGGTRRACRLPGMCGVLIPLGVRRGESEDELELLSLRTADPRARVATGLWSAAFLLSWRPDFLCTRAMASGFASPSRSFTLGVLKPEESESESDSTGTTTGGAAVLDVALSPSVFLPVFFFPGFAGGLA